MLVCICKKKESGEKKIYTPFILRTAFVFVMLGLYNMTGQ